MNKRLPKLEEIFTGGLSLLASPKLIVSLDRRRKANKDLDVLLRAFDNPRRRQHMCKRGWKWLDSQVEHRLKQGGAPFVAICGDRGIGKSEAEATLMFRLEEAYRKFLGINVVFGIGRNPSDINELLARATEKGWVAIVASDESERELGVGSKTEEQALLDNLETIRVLLHSIIRCANRYAKFKIFSYYCDFVLEVIFRDNHNRCNYAILYVIDEEAGSDPRIPLFIIDLPLHDHKWFRTDYEKMKITDQIEFTTSGGRRSRIKKKLLPAVQALVKLCKEEGYEAGNGKDIKRVEDLMPKLVFHVTNERFGVRGDKWNTTEMRLICLEAFSLLKQETDETQDGRDDATFKDYLWGTDFEWRENIARLMDNHPHYGKYHLYYVASEVMGLNYYTGSTKFEKVTGFKISTNRKWTGRMNKDERFQGWLKDRRGRMYESYVAQKLRDAGWIVKVKPKFKHDGFQYEEDLLISKNNKEVWINAKCGFQRTYVKEEYKTTFILSDVLGKEAYIIFLDLGNERCEIHLPATRINTGSGNSTAINASSATRSGASRRKANISTPSLILEALKTGTQKA